MIEYTLITHDDSGFSRKKGTLKFIEKVNEKLSDGWKYQGGIQLGSSYSYAQAMVKEIK